MLTENEPMWKAYREQMRLLIDKLDFKAVWGWVDDKTPNEMTDDLPDHDTLKNAREFLDDLVCSHYVNIPTVDVVGRNVEIQWKTHQSNLQVTFMPENEWNVFHENCIAEGFGPEPTFWIDATEKHPREPHFFLEDHLIKEIERPQQWTMKYEPLMSHMKILWATGYWDGPLSGYCNRSYNVNDLYYFDCVEELTYSPRTRMYAVYELSPKEQIDAMRLKYTWFALYKRPWMWWLYMKFFRGVFKFFRAENDREQWKNAHKLLGYFTY
jgi:hypothetical protein